MQNYRDAMNQDQQVGVASIGYTVDRMPRSPFPIKSSPMSELCRLCFCDGSLSWDFFAIGARKSGLRHHNRKSRGSAAHKLKELHHPPALCNAGADPSGQDSFIPGLRERGWLEPCRLFDAICASCSQQEQEEQDLSDFQEVLHFQERFDVRLLKFRWPIRAAGLF